MSPYSFLKINEEYVEKTTTREKIFNLIPHILFISIITISLIVVIVKWGNIDKPLPPSIYRSCMSSDDWGGKRINHGESASKTCSNGIVITKTCYDGNWNNIGHCPCINGGIFNNINANSGDDLDILCLDGSTIKSHCREGIWTYDSKCPLCTISCDDNFKCKRVCDKL